MADLTDLQSAQTVKIAGANPSTGIESNFVEVGPDGSLFVKPKQSSSTTTSTVAAATSNQTLLASNANRIGVTIYNDSNSTLYLKLGAVASTTSFTLLMAAKSYYEIPYGYTGQIDGLWANANGAARIGELT
jgi:hypothetical protein